METISQIEKQEETDYIGDKRDSDFDIEFDKLMLSKTKQNICIPFKSKYTYSKSDFQVIELLGKGAYAKVVKAKCLKDNLIKAIKIVDKIFIEKEKKLYQVYIENNILSKLSHPNIIRIDGIFEENEKIFMIVEYLSGGDLFQLLKNNGTSYLNVAPLKLETIQFLIAEIINALEYLHKQGIAHRDLKPENIMLDENYHLKLIDFATATIHGKVFDKSTMEFQDEDNINQTGPIEEFHEKKKQRHTFVGTAEYVSPEVLADKASGIESDLWALGCIIYQCFTGTTPFKEKTEYLIFKKILEHNFTFPDDFPETAKNLVELLLVEKPENRLGAGACLNPDNFLELKRHKFFDGIDFERLHETTIPNKSAFNKLTDSKKSPEKIRQNSVRVIKQDIIEKKSPWFHYNTRKVILYNTPKIDYIDPSKNIVKGVIYLNRQCSAKYVDNYIFLLITPNRTFKFKTAKYESGVWTKTINDAIEEFSKE